ncbi:hypothetical protein Tco_1428455 [Tanacetum coccineum]
MAPNVEVNLRRLLELGKNDLSLNEYLDQCCGDQDTPVLNTSTLAWVVARRVQKIPESPWGSPIPIGDGDGDANRFPDGDGDGDGDEAEKRGWGW